MITKVSFIIFVNVLIVLQVQTGSTFNDIFHFFRDIAALHYIILCSITLSKQRFFIASDNCIRQLNNSPKLFERLLTCTQFFISNNKDTIIYYNRQGVYCRQRRLLLFILCLKKD